MSGAGTARHRLAGWLRRIPPASAREALLALAGLVAVGAVVYGPHVAHGGFYSDDWNNYALYRYDSGAGSVGEILARFGELTAFRPFLVVYVPLTDLVFGTNSHLHLAWGVFLGCLMAAAFYWVLRILGLERRHAAPLAILFLLFPPSDSTRLWGTSAHASLAVALYLLGLMAALRGLDRRGARAVIWHVCALVLYFLALCCHELVAPGVLAAFLVYRFYSKAWGPALIRWAPDFVLLAGTVLLITTSGTNPVERQTITGMVLHGIEIARQAVSIASESLLPVIAYQPLLVVCGLAVLVAIALVVGRSLPVDDVARNRLTRWLTIGAAGVLAAGIAYLIFVPAPSQGSYEPLAVGVGKRVNLLAGAGFVIMAYSAIQVLATLVFRSLPDSRRWVPRAALGATFILILGYAYSGVRHAAEWDRAADIQEEVLAAIRSADPDPDPGTTFFTSRHPAYSVPGVPGAAFSYDVNGAVKVLYDDGSIEAYPIAQDTILRCKKAGIEGMGSYRYEGVTNTAYGAAVFVDVKDRRFTIPRDRRSCRIAIWSNLPGPTIEAPGWRDG